MEPTFRLAGDADVDTILAFMRPFYEHDKVPFDEALARRALARIVRDRALGRVWVICDGADPIGYVVLTLGYSLEYHGRDACVDELYIHESRRRQGIGAKAVRFLEQACRELDVQALHLEADRPNVAAQELYRKLGFVDHDRYLMTRRIEYRKKEEGA